MQLIIFSTTLLNELLILFFKLDKDFILSVLNNNVKVKQLVVNPGTLVLFYGRNYLHRVTPVTSKKCRILVTLNYNLEEDVELSENARLTFFGRIK